MKSLHRFAQIWNTEIIADMNLQASDEFIHDIVRVLSKYTTAPESGSLTRMSSLGKPLVELAYRKIKAYKESFTPAEMWVCAMGDFAEALIIELMSMHGIAVTRYQQEVYLYNGRVVGHIDGVIDDDTVFDIKCMGTTYFKQFTNNPNDDRGYLTQLSLYRAALKLPKAAFLCLDKTYGTMEVIKLTDKAYQTALAEVGNKLATLQQIKTEVDILELLEPPEPKPNKAGKLVIPDSMSFSPYKEVIYGGIYYADPKHMKQWET